MKFLAFVSSNLDEFFEIRVSGVMQQVKSGVVESGPDGLGPKEQLRHVQNITRRLVADQYDCWHKKIVPGLEASRIKFCAYPELTRNEKKWVASYFEDQIFPVLTPLAIDPAHPFPQLTNKALHILASIDDANIRKTDPLMAIIQVPRILPRIVKIGVARRDNPEVYITLSDIIQPYVKQLFPGYRVQSSVPFRITRNSDLYINEEEAVNLLSQIEDELVNREKGSAVRLEIGKGADPALLQKLLEAIHLGPENVYTIDGLINMARLMSAYDLIDRPDLKFPPQISYTHPDLKSPEHLFEHISEKDYLLHQPYDSFQPFLDFIYQAANDPKVFAIKQTLYRTSGDSPIVKALIEASLKGKQVTVIVELKARFDEANNIKWARRLEEVGAHVVYGFVGLKTHCKACMIVRREGKGLRRYVHLGTGNYNPKTAKLYTDLSFFTARKEFTEEVAKLFNTLTGFSRDPNFKKLLVAPFNLQATIQRYIQTETRNAKSGKPARIIVQVNSLVDQKTINHLYRASQAGVKIDLIIRGVCSLVPNIKGVSENIRVRSILGRYLEHSRIFYFENACGLKPHVLVGSADWMPRNFYHRIEAVFPIEAPEMHKRIIHLLETYLKDTCDAHKLHSDGSYRILSSKNTEAFSAQKIFSKDALQRFQRLEKQPSEKDPGSMPQVATPQSRMPS